MGLVEEVEADKTTFVYHTPATCNYKQGSGLSVLVAVVLSVLTILVILPPPSCSSGSR